MLVLVCLKQLFSHSGANNDDIVRTYGVVCFPSWFFVSLRFFCWSLSLPTGMFVFAAKSRYFSLFPSTYVVLLLLFIVFFPDGFLTL